LDALWTRPRKIRLRKRLAQRVKGHEAFREVLVVSGRLFAAESSKRLSVSIVVLDRGVAFGADRFQAGLEDYPLLREFGRSPWEAVNRLVGAHRGLLERRWTS
jgi:hypothetical protein